MIPRRIHFCWLSGDPLPALIETCVDSWKRLLPDYEVVQWNAQSLVSEPFPCWVHEAVDARKFAFAADYIRLYALHGHGGVYLDADVQILRSFDSLLARTSFIGRETGGDLEPAVIGSVPGSPWLRDAMDYYRDRHFRKADGTFDMRPLPLVLAEVLHRKYGAMDLSTVERQYCEAAQLDVFESAVFSPKCRVTGRVDSTIDSFAIHHFDGQWIDKSMLTHIKNKVHRLVLSLAGRQGHAEFVRWIRLWRS